MARATRCNNAPGSEGKGGSDMRTRLIALATIALAIVVVGRFPISGYATTTAVHTDDSAFTQKEEINQAVNLGGSGNIQVSGINGTLEVDTTSGAGVAQVHIVRSAPTQEDLAHHKILIEQKD